MAVEKARGSVGSAPDIPGSRLPEPAGLALSAVAEDAGAVGPPATVDSQPLPQTRVFRRARFFAPERVRTLVLVAVVVVLGALTAVFGAAAVSPALLAVPVLVGGLTLAPRRLAVVLGATAAMLVVDVITAGFRATRWGTVVAVVIVGYLSAQLAQNRERLGVTPGGGESLLRSLREHLRAISQLPTLPAPWHAEVVQRSADGGGFGGDFIISSLGDGGRRLELALVDVSGKGLDAATRALLLAGAYGGLLGALPPERFLSAANSYLLDLRWPEGFATAVHLALDLQTGEYRLASAGHPPVGHLVGGRGTWRLADTPGSVLGVMREPTFGVETGVLRAQDALLLYTDGVVEVPGRDLSVGIDRLLGAAERLVPRGFTGGAARLVDAVSPRVSDDQALVLLWGG